MGMKSTGLLNFYKANLKPVISYACPTWYIFLAEKDKTELERLFIDIECYEEHMSQLHLPTVNSFLFSTAENDYFSKISDDPSHPIFSRITLNTFKTSSRKPVKYSTEKCRTEKRK